MAVAVGVGGAADKPLLQQHQWQHLQSAATMGGMGVGSTSIVLAGVSVSTLERGAVMSSAGVDASPACAMVRGRVCAHRVFSSWRAQALCSSS